MQVFVRLTFFFSYKNVSRPDLLSNSQHVSAVAGTASLYSRFFWFWSPLRDKQELTLKSCVFICICVCYIWTRNHESEKRPFQNRPPLPSFLLSHHPQLHDQAIYLFNLSPSPGLPAVGELRSDPSSSYNLKCEPNQYWEPRAVGQRQYHSPALSFLSTSPFFPPSFPARLSTPRRQIECERTVLNVKIQEALVSAARFRLWRETAVLFLLFLFFLPLFQRYYMYMADICQTGQCSIACGGNELGLLAS